MSKFTQEDLVQYLYKETSEQKTAAIKVALETDWELAGIIRTNLSPAKKILKKLIFLRGRKQ